MAVPPLPDVVAPTLAIVDTDARFPIRRVFCMGRNYHWQPVAPGALPQRETPFFFMKPAHAVVPATGTIAFAPRTQEFCHEIELVVAIGRDGADIGVADALSHVWGYAAGLDLTRREVQAEAKRAGRPWEASKAFDDSAPCGPLVPARLVDGAPARGAIWLSVNGVERQRSDMAQLIWSVAEVIAFLSTCVTLRAGDLIFTGTPGGVDTLEPGDRVHGHIDGVGHFDVDIGSRRIELPDSTTHDMETPA